MSTIYPRPKIGFYTAAGRMSDLRQIKTIEHLDEALERIGFNFEEGELMVFASLSDAIECLRDAETPEDLAIEFEILGWDDDAKVQVSRIT